MSDNKKYQGYNAVKKDSIIIEGLKLPILKKNTQKNDPLGPIKGIVLHHTAGHYKDIYDDYHFNIPFIKNKASVVKTLNFSQKGQHIWGRNTGEIGISLDCLATPDIVPQYDQLDCMAILIAEICAWKRIDPKGTHSSYNPNTGVLIPNAPNITDHKFYSSQKYDKYGKIDIKDLDLVLKLVDKYYKELKSNERQFMFVDLLKE